MSIDLEDVIQPIHDASLKVEDFDFKEKDTTGQPNSLGIAVVQGVIIATYKPTGKTATYDNGSPSKWEIDFTSDLEAGFYTKT